MASANHPHPAAQQQTQDEPTSLRSRIVHVATALTREAGWSSVSMGRLAEQVGVSRQTIHTEIGSKRQLAEEVVFAELQQFLTLVDDAFQSHPTDLTAAVRTACREVLRRAAESPLLHAIVSTSHGARHDLLPLLTTQSDTLIDTAKTVLRTRLSPRTRPVSDQHLSAVTDMVVRTILSHVMQPSASPEHTADTIAWVVHQLLA